MYTHTCTRTYTHTYCSCIIIIRVVDTQVMQETYFTYCVAIDMYVCMYNFVCIATVRLVHVLSASFSTSIE